MVDSIIRIEELSRNIEELLRSIEELVSTLKLIPLQASNLKTLFFLRMNYYWTSKGYPKPVFFIGIVGCPSYMAVYRIKSPGEPV